MQRPYPLWISGSCYLIAVICYPLKDNGKSAIPRSIQPAQNFDASSLIKSRHRHE
jgi:hypothetical protein